MPSTVYDLLNENNIDKLNIDKDKKKYIKKLLSNLISIDNLNTVLRKIGINEWEKNKEKQSYKYENLYKRTINLLKNETDIKNVITGIYYFNDIKQIIGDKKYNEFINLLNSLHYHIHNDYKKDIVNKEKQLLSKYLSLYTAINKEKYISNKINEYQHEYKKYFKINPNSVIAQKYKERAQINYLKELYKSNKLLDQITLIKKEYSYFTKEINIDNKELELLIDLFIKKIIEERIHSIDDIINKDDINYEKKAYLFKKVRRDIIKYAKTLNINYDNIDESKLKNIKFNDDNYIFNIEKLKEIPINKFLKYINILTNIDDKLYIDDNIILIGLVADNDYINDKKVYSMFKNIEEITNYTNIINFNNLLYILEINNIINNDAKILSMLGYKVIEKTKNNNTFTYDNFEKKLTMLCDLTAQKYKRNTSTTPYIEGKYENLSYSVYNIIENDVLTCGIDTNTCLKVTGAENDFLHYTILSKNGINLKITDKDNNLVARISGNRYGNGLYFNQLRVPDNSTIDDNIIIKAFEQACEDIINNSAEDEKIEFIIVTKSYLTKNMKSNINPELSNYIAINAVDNKSKDWDDFIKNKNLDESYHGVFINDYGTTDLICIKSIIGDITIDKIKFYSAKDKYKRPRKKIKTYKSNVEIEKEINKVNSIYCYNNNLKYKYLKLDPTDNVICGDNWYIIYNNKIKESMCLKEDKQAIIEYEIAFSYIKEYLENNNKIIRHKVPTYV